MTVFRRELSGGELIDAVSPDCPMCEAENSMRLRHEETDWFELRCLECGRRGDRRATLEEACRSWLDWCLAC